MRGSGDALRVQRAAERLLHELRAARPASRDELCAAANLDRLAELWGEGLARFGGPFLAGSALTAVDAFYAPVAFRVQTYGLRLPSTGAEYARRLLDLAAMKSWYAAVLQEPWRDEAHEIEVLQVGTVLQDMRSAPGT